MQSRGARPWKLEEVNRLGQEGIEWFCREMASDSAIHEQDPAHAFIFPPPDGVRGPWPCFHRKINRDPAWDVALHAPAQEEEEQERRWQERDEAVEDDEGAEEDDEGAEEEEQGERAAELGGSAAPGTSDVADPESVYYADSVSLRRQ
jgi:hypothetical protein